MRTPTPGEDASIVAGSYIDGDDLRQEDDDVRLLRLELTDRSGDLGRGEDGGCHLIEQRLKNVVVPSIDQDDLDVSVSQRVRSGDPGKAAADDNDALALRTWRAYDGCCLVTQPVHQHRAHGSPLFVLLVIHGSSSSPFGNGVLKTPAIRVCSILAAQVPF